MQILRPAYAVVGIGQDVREATAAELLLAALLGGVAGGCYAYGWGREEGTAGGITRGTEAKPRELFWLVGFVYRCTVHILPGSAMGGFLQ
jgi:hypothetical protein